MLRAFSRFRKDKKGLAAIEFAFVAPVMLTFFFGLVEVSQALICRSSVINLAATGADLIAQESSVSSADMTNVFNALSATLFPYPTAPAKITITSLVDNNANDSGKVAWSCTHGGTARAVNAIVPIPYTAGNPPLITPGGGGSIIFAEVTYDYTSAISSYFVGPVTFTNTYYSKPRLVAQVPKTGACP